MHSQGVALVVEDDEDIRLLIATVLQQRGFGVVGVGEGRHAQALAVEHRPVLITLDLGLPDLDGFEVCRRLRTVTDAYLIMISARADEVDRLLGLEIGADDYLTKPFSPRELATRVGVLMRRPRDGHRPGAGEAVGAQPADPRPRAAGGAVAGAAGGAAATVAEDRAVPVEQATATDTADEGVLAESRLRVDPDSHSAVLDGRELDLTRTEFDLLVAFLSHPRPAGAAAGLRGS